ncbi:MAG: maleylpyruvate isomerase N-terminal domain-containing protein [Acidimicrobiales bacterium]
MSATLEVDPVAARAALAGSATRFTDLLRSVDDGTTPAIGVWNITNLAAHVSHGLDAITALARGSGSVLDDVWDLSRLSATLVEGESTRRPADLATRVDATVAELLAVTDATDAAAMRPWMVGGVELPVAGLLCHALNELEVHGRDIALAGGSTWSIERPHAVLVLEGFLFPALGGLGRAMVDQRATSGLRACLEVRPRGGRTVYWSFDDGDLTIGRSRPRRVDCHLSVDPAAFLLVSWNRIGQWPAIMRGQLLAWGRRPWLGLKLRSLMRNP